MEGIEEPSCGICPSLPCLKSLLSLLLRLHEMLNLFDGHIVSLQTLGVFDEVGLEPVGVLRFEDVHGSLSMLLGLGPLLFSLMLVFKVGLAVDGATEFLPDLLVAWVLRHTIALASEMCRSPSGRYLLLLIFQDFLQLHVCSGLLQIHSGADGL